MGRGPQAEAIPDLARALRHLRERAGLTAQGVSEHVAQRGGSVSAVYYRQIESGKRFPSPPARAAILDALGSSDAQLAALLRDRPWDAEGPPGGVAAASMAAPVPAGAMADMTAEDLVAAVAAVAPALSASRRRLVAGLARELAGRP